MYEVLGYDAVSDLTLILEDEEFEQIGLSPDAARSIQRAARIRVLERHIHDGGAGEYPGAEDLYRLGYDEPAMLRHLDRADARQLGLSDAQSKRLIGLGHSALAPGEVREQHDEL